jgi:hypothetical protein
MTKSDGPIENHILEALQRRHKIELNPKREEVLRAKLDEYRQRLLSQTSGDVIASAALDTHMKVLFLTELLKSGSLGGGDVIVTIDSDETGLDMAQAIGARKKVDPAALIAKLAENAFDVIKDYNDTGGRDTRAGQLPTEGKKLPEVN